MARLSNPAAVNGLRKAYIQLYVQNATSAAYTDTVNDEEDKSRCLITGTAKFTAWFIMAANKPGSGYSNVTRRLWLGNYINNFK